MVSHTARHTALRIIREYRMKERKGPISELERVRSGLPRGPLGAPASAELAAPLLTEEARCQLGRELDANLGIHPFVTLETQLLNMIGHLG